MEYKKILNLLDNAQNEPSKFRTRNWAEINDASRETYNASDQIKSKTSMIRSNLCDYSDSYRLLSGTITITEEEADDTAKQLNERNKGVEFKDCARFTVCISNINNTQIKNAKDIVNVMSIHNLLEYSDNYLKTSRRLWQYYRNDPNDNITQSELFKSNIKITGKASADGNTKHVEIVVSLKQLSNFWRTLEMPLINCETSLILN